MEMEIADTIRDINEKEWDTLVGTDYLERSHAWYRTVEDSGTRTMYYVFLKENETLEAAACCYPLTEKMYIELPFLEVRSPLGTSLAFFSKTPEQAAMLMKGLEEIQKKERARGILILDLRKREFNAIKKQMKGFVELPISDNTYVDLNFTDFKDYLSSLSRKRRKSIKHTLNKARKKWEIKPLFTNEFSTWKEVACRLQGHTRERHNGYRWLLTEKFYEALEKNMKENAELLLFFKDDVPILFAVSLNTSEISLYKFMGSDPKYREYQAYFLMFYEGIKRAIEKKQKRIYYGPTSYEFKEKIGCKREELFGLARLNNPVLHLGLKSYSIVTKLSEKRFWVL
ncbi:MAG: GNAT family N-acetyltransferase [Theionarchaea archaeon]|nr:GNAT family N-acetyltransferase [Theionarchaea archaeon]